MLVLGLQGSPRKKGNTDALLSAYMAEAGNLGAETLVVDVCRQNILPCRELIVCEKKGICPIVDDMDKHIYPLLRRADVIIAATPIFFYNATAQLKALIDRCQTLWARKYKLRLTDPGRGYRRGFVLSVAATRGKQLFDGLNLTMAYFFDAVGADFQGSLTYRGVEQRGDIQKLPDFAEQVSQSVQSLIGPLVQRRQVVFAGEANAGRSQMAAAFARHMAGEQFDVVAGGRQPAATVAPAMVKVMAEKGIDMGFIHPRPLPDPLVSVSATPAVVVSMQGHEAFDHLPGIEHIQWDIPDPMGQSENHMRQVRDDIETRVARLVETISSPNFMKPTG